MAHVLVVCAKRYNGHELWTALGVIQNRGHTFEVVSQSTRIMDEITFKPNDIDRTVWEVRPEEIANYDGIMIVSGNMKDTEDYWDDVHVLRLIQLTSEQGKAVAAICCSVPTIREVATNKRVSFFPLVRSRERLLAHGAILTKVACTVDGTLVTAEHQMATQMWANAYCDVLEGKEDADPGLVDSGYVPRGRPRKPIPEVEAVKEAMKRDASSNS